MKDGKNSGNGKHYKEPDKQAGFLAGAPVCSKANYLISKNIQIVTDYSYN